MTHHLSPEEFVDAVDSTLTPVRLAHVESCETCRRELATLREMLADATGVPAAEPSPLFWDHFSARVAAATDSATVEPARRWWQPVWKPLAAGAGLAAAAALAVSLATTSPGVVSPSQETTQADAGAFIGGDDDGSWEFVVGLSSDLSFEYVREAVIPAAGTADEAIAALNAEQRAELVRLLRQEIGEP